MLTENLLAIYTLFTIRMSIIPPPSFGRDGIVGIVHVPVGMQMHVCGGAIGGIGMIVGNGNGDMNGGGRNGNLPRETNTKIESEIEY